MLTTLYGQKVRWLADSGAAISVIDESKMPPQVRGKLRRLPVPPGFTIQGATGHIFPLRGRFELQLATNERTFVHPVYVVSGLRAGAILGIDFLARFDASIHARSLQVTFGATQPLPSDSDSAVTTRQLRVTKETKVPAGRAVTVQAIATAPITTGSLSRLTADREPSSGIS